jgi:hypothetical protein
MGIWDAFSEIVEAVTPWSVVEAEAPAEESQVGGMSFFGVGRGKRQKEGDMFGQLCRPCFLDRRGGQICRAASELQARGGYVHFPCGSGAN